MPLPIAHAKAEWSISRQQWVIRWHGREVDYFAVEPATSLEVARLNQICRDRKCSGGLED